MLFGYQAEAVEEICVDGGRATRLDDTENANATGDKIVAMSTKERLHELVDELSEAEAAHARIVVENASKPGETLSGSLPHLPDLGCEDFERASQDLTAA